MKFTEDYLEWNMLPDNWALCFDNDCPLREKCVRWQAGQIMPDENYCSMCVMPCARIGNNCWMYVEKNDSVTYKELFKHHPITRRLLQKSDKKNSSTNYP